jgi:hypothetical protein
MRLASKLRTEKLQIETDKLQDHTHTTKSDRETEHEKILCLHCQRTATNGIKCKGICVAESDY